MSKGLFITYEGKDGSGKSTHSEALYNSLKESGHKVKLVHFPRYENSIGGLIGKMLNGEVPMLESFEAFQMLCVADQLDFQKELRKYINDGYIVIADRYDLSTIAYYISKKDVPTAIGYNYIRKWQSDLLEPDLTFIFDYNQDLNERRKDMDKECDAIESDKQITNKIRDVYKELYYILNDCKEMSKTTREVYLVDTNFDFAHNSVAINNVIKHKMRRNMQMTNMAQLLKIFNNTNLDIQDIAETYEDMDKLFSIKRVKNQLPFNIDFELLKENGFEPKEFLSATKMEAELIIKKVN